MDSTNWGMVWGLIGGLIGSLVTVWFFSVRRQLEAGRGEFTGDWKQIIPAHDGEPEKIAIVKCKHIGDKLHGQTTRTSPKAEFVQRWEVEARIKKGLVFGIYWPEDSSKLPGSYGTLQFRIVHENLFEGFYVRARMTQTDGQGGYVETLKTIPLRWERQHKKVDK